MQAHQYPSLSTLEMARKLTGEGSTQEGWKKSCSNLLLVSRE